MTDLALRWNAALGHADLVVAGEDLAVDDGLVSAMLISLFSDARVDAGDLPPGSTERRGWWGSLLQPGDGDDAGIGSRIWLRERGKAVGDVAAEAERDAEAALVWLVEDGALEAVSVRAERRGDMLAFLVRAKLPDGSVREHEFQNAGAG